MGADCRRRAGWSRCGDRGIIGASLPRDHVASDSARIAAPPDVVWETITTSPIAAWRADVKSVEPLPAAPTGRHGANTRGNGAIAMVVVVAEPPHRRWRGSPTRISLRRRRGSIAWRRTAPAEAS